MANELDGRNVAILIAPVGTEEVEFTQPKQAVENAGATVEVISFESGEAQTMNQDVDKGKKFPMDKVVTDVPPGITMRSSYPEARSARTGSAAMPTS